MLGAQPGQKGIGAVGTLPHGGAPTKTPGKPQAASATSATTKNGTPGANGTHAFGINIGGGVPAGIKYGPGSVAIVAQVVGSMAKNLTMTEQPVELDASAIWALAPNPTAHASANRIIFFLYHAFLMTKNLKFKNDAYSFKDFRLLPWLTEMKMQQYYNTGF
jgi:hypothetical protein